MFLKRIEITGFKSFATKSVLDFDKGRHITAIVGPNGSGKSNVADAVRWVLGETSYKTVRAKKSEDVIFSGSNGKAKASCAKVSILLDNADKRAPIDFTEVEISRAVYRDGSSEYLIAGKKSRLLDVAELLARSGFGQSTYSVIGQGMVDSMLFYGPAERKVLFDEAAGVRQYEIKREQTLRKLEDTHGNVVRARDILSELTPRLSTLKKQTEKAKEKDTVKSTLLDKQKTYFSTIWDKLNHDEKQKRQKLDKLVSEESKVSAEIESLNKSFGEILGKERADSGEIEKLQGEITALEKQKDIIRQAIFTLKTKMELTFSAPTQKELEKKIKETEALLKDLDTEGKSLAQEDIQSELELFRAKGYPEKIRILEQDRETYRQEFYTKKAELRMSDSSSSLTKEELGEKLKELRKKLEGLRSQGLEDQKVKISKEVESLAGQSEEVAQLILTKEKKLSDLSEKLKGFDFGVVGKKVSAVLELQKKLIQKLASAKTTQEISLCLTQAQGIEGHLDDLFGQVSDVKEGRISGMTEIQQEIRTLVDKKEQLTSRLNDLRSQLMKLDFEIKGTSDSRNLVESEIAKLESLEPIDPKSIKNKEKEVSDLEARISNINEEISVLRSEMSAEAAIISRLNQGEYEIRREKEKEEIIKKEIERLRSMKPADEGERVEIQSQIDQKELEISALDEKIKSIRKNISNQSSVFDSQGQRLSEIKDSLTAKQALLAEYNGEVTNVRIGLARIETRKQDIKEEIVYEMGSETALAGAQIVPELDEEAARKEIERLKNRLYAIGEIDSEVETEFEEVNSRVEFLSKQTDDLERAKADLEKLVSELDQKIKKQFESSFDAISKKFTHFFELLFDGGVAKLELVKQKIDEEDEDSSDRFGIEITAIPPGKKVKSLSALSGGERTLTSLALLFAILSVNPAPFCVLDEVDAALDESNTKRFLKIVEELSKETQFIFITHNRETMKPASVIYGVTMDESHASKLLSIKLEEAEKTVKS